MCIGVSTPPPCSCQAPLKLPNCSSLPPFLGNLPLYVGFSWAPTTLKVGFFSEPLIYWSFSYLTPSNLLKVTKFSLKISKLEFLVMTEKNIFAYKLFLSLNISNFNLFFMQKLQTFLKKVAPSFPATPLKKLRSCQVPLFQNLVGGSLCLSTRNIDFCEFLNQLLKYGTFFYRLR